MTKLIALALLLAQAVFGQAPTTATNHYEMVKAARMFGITAGFGGRTAAGDSFMAISAQANAADTFLRLTHEVGPVAKLFGLLGLQTTAPTQFSNALPSLLTNTAPVSAAVGCMVLNADVATLAKEIQQGKWSVPRIPEPTPNRPAGK